MASKRFAIRTIRNGKVKINGYYYAPAFRHHVTSIPYMGQLDNQRWVFGLYGDYRGSDGHRFVSLWGTERAYYGGPDTDWPGPNCINGQFQWDWWNEVI